MADLTKKQHEFVENYVETGNGTKAALEAYDTENPRTAAAIASENLTKPNIIQALYELGFNSDNANRVVAEILNDETNEPKDRLKAAELVYKVQGDFAPEKHITITKKVISVDE